MIPKNFIKNTTCLLFLVMANLFNSVAIAGNSRFFCPMTITCLDPGKISQCKLSTEGLSGYWGQPRFEYKADSIVGIYKFHSAKSQLTPMGSPDIKCIYMNSEQSRNLMYLVPRSINSVEILNEKNSNWRGSDSHGSECNASDPGLCPFKLNNNIYIRNVRVFQGILLEINNKVIANRLFANSTQKFSFDEIRKLCSKTRFCKIKLYTDLKNHSFGEITLDLDNESVSYTKEHMTIKINRTSLYNEVNVGYPRNDITVFFPPSEYICNPDKSYYCQCRQEESEYFPEHIQGAFTCKDIKNKVLKFKSISIGNFSTQDTRITGRAVYGNGFTQNLMVHSYPEVSRGASPHWSGRTPSCAGYACDLILKD